MAFFIQFPDDPDSHGSAGAKASVLARLTREGLPIPPWFAVTSEAFHGNLSRAQREAMAAAETPSALAAVIAEITLTPSFLEELDAALVRLSPDDKPVVVRPSLSAVDQDSYEAAADVHIQLSTPSAGVAERIAEIYRAAFSEAVLVHRRRHMLPLCPEPPAVLIQHMVDPDAAGAAFGADLTTGQRGIAVVAAVFGLPSSLSSGECQPDLYRIDRSGQVIQRDIAKKTVSHRPSGDTPAGYAVREIPAAQCDAPVLSPGEAVRVDGLLRRAERSFECPQEIHWALEGDALYLLDARPLVQLDRYADPDSPAQYFDSGALAELFPGAVLPLTISVVQRAAPHIADAFLFGAGLSDDQIAERTRYSQSLVAVVRGRIYASLSSWYGLLAALPDYPACARSYGRLAGWAGGISRKAEAEVAAGVTFNVSKLRTALALYRGFGSMPDRTAAFHRAVVSALKQVPDSLERSRLDELIENFRQMEQDLLPVWDAPPLNEYYTMVVYGHLLKQARTCWPHDHGAAIAGLLSRGGGKWLPPAIGKVQQIAVEAAGDAAALETFRSGNMDEIFGALHRLPAVKAACEDFIAKHGGMTFGGYKLEATPLADGPLPLFRAIAQASLALDARGDVPAAQLPRRDDILAASRVGPIARMKLRWLTRHTRARLRDRDLIETDIQRVIAKLRVIFLEIGRRLYALGNLDSPRDIFYLTIDEVLGFTDASIPTTDLASLVAARRVHYEALAQMPPPVGHLEIHLPPTSGVALDQRPDTAPGERTGNGVSAGVVRGRVVTAGGSTCAQDGPMVLVAPHAHSSWPMLYPGVAGIVIEQGGALSHSVLGYRDQRIPTVIGIPGACEWLGDGDLVEIDGAYGTVRKLDAAEERAHLYSAKAADAGWSSIPLLPDDQPDAPAPFTLADAHEYDAQEPADAAPDSAPGTDTDSSGDTDDTGDEKHQPAGNAGIIISQ